MPSSTSLPQISNASSKPPSVSKRSVAMATQAPVLASTLRGTALEMKGVG